jgi:ATP-dependent RNA helicase RhlB
MDLHEFGIDQRLASTIEAAGLSPYVFEKLLSRTIKDGESVCAKINLEAGREEVALLPALHWILSAQGSESRRALIVSADRSSADAFSKTAVRLARSVDVNTCTVELTGTEDMQSVSLQGPADAEVVVGIPESLLAASSAGLIHFRSFGFLVVDGTDQLAERSIDLMRRLGGVLLPSWERKSVLVCDRLTLKAKNLAWDLADNPAELSIDGEVSKAQSVTKETWRVDSDEKFRLLLGIIKKEQPAWFCVFCNLRDSAEEIAKRLNVNGIRSDFIIGALAIDRKRAVVDKIASGRGSALVLTDKGAEGLPPGRFPLVVNYDFPLEPELFVKRLEMLDRSAAGGKVISIVCDRYIYGLPAVEQYIEAKLDTTPVLPSMLDVEDKSEGMDFERRSVDRGAVYNDMHPRENQQAYRNRVHDAGSWRRGDREDVQSREDRVPDIRRSISEATGGSLDIGATSIPRKEIPKTNKLVDEKRIRSSSTIRDRDAYKDRKPFRTAKHEVASPLPRRNNTHDEAAASNPYSIPMEERMKHYREKYARYLSGTDSRTGSKNQRQAERPRGPGADDAEEP